jgi:hypothetical protein
MKSIIYLLLLTLLLSCESDNQQNQFVANPTTLEELFRGFNEAELTPEINQLNKEPIIVVATGHLYPLLNYPEVYNSFIEEIKNQNPDYFFQLGDIVRDNTDEEWDSVFYRLNQINALIYHAPGNHDLNYHHERYFGKRVNQVEAEMRYLNQVGYRYKLVKDELANYVFINANDSVHRILSFIDQIRHKLDTNKQQILLSSQSLWVNKQQDPDNPKTWVNRPFNRNELLPHIENFDVLIHGDWGGKFYRGAWKKSNGTFDLMAAGNRKVGDSLFITRLEIFSDTIKAWPIKVHIPETSFWFDN